jgi:hypothetical protein
MAQKRAVQKQVANAKMTVSRAGKKKVGGSRLFPHPHPYHALSLSPPLQNPASAAPTAVPTSSVKKPRNALQLWMEEKALSLADRFKLAKAADPERWDGPGFYMRYAAEQWREVRDKSEWEEWAAEDRLRYRVQKGEEEQARAAKH